MTPFDKEKRGQSESKGASPGHQNHKTRRQQTTPQNANQSNSNSKSGQKQKKIQKVSKTITHVWKISIPSKAARIGTLETKLQSKWDRHPAPVHPAGTLAIRINCMLKTWSLDGKNAQNHNGNAQIFQTPAKGGKKNGEKKRRSN